MYHIRQTDERKGKKRTLCLSGCTNATKGHPNKRARYIDITDRASAMHYEEREDKLKIQKNNSVTAIMIMTAAAGAYWKQNDMSPKDSQYNADACAS